MRTRVPWSIWEAPGRQINRGDIFMNNIHGQRINRDVLKPSGSGYIGSHGEDFCLSNDTWSQILNLRYGPDGQVYMIDWYDKNACHHGNVEGHDRSNGRIFKISYGPPKPVTVDLAKESDEQLAQRMLEPNDWYVRACAAGVGRACRARTDQAGGCRGADENCAGTCRRNEAAARSVGAACQRFARRIADSQIPGRSESLRARLGHPARRRQSGPRDRTGNAGPAGTTGRQRSFAGGAALSGFAGATAAGGAALEHAGRARRAQRR